jgi:hypothetical protein
MTSHGFRVATTTVEYDDTDEVHVGAVAIDVYEKGYYVCIEGTKVNYVRRIYV